MKLNYYFFTEGKPTPNISFGHFFRCLELAKNLKNKGHKCIFVIENNKYVIKFLSRYNFKSLKFSFLKKKKIIKNRTVFVYDKYRLQKKEFNFGKNLKKILFDDYNKYSSYKNCIRITTNLGQKKYKKNHINSFSFRLSKFLNDHIKPDVMNKNEFLIFIGGSDIKKNLDKILKKIKIEKIYAHYKFNFYLGPGVRKKFKSKIKNISFFKNNEKKLTNLIKKSKYVFTNGGNTMFEMLMRKKICLIFPSNKVEFDNSMYLKKNNLVRIYDKNQKLEKQIKSLFVLDKLNYIKKNKLFRIGNIKKDFDKILS